MFIVWRSRKRQYWDQFRHSARLVESVRINGKPRHRLVGCLGSFTWWRSEAHPDGPPEDDMLGQRRRFWKKTHRVLDGLGDRITAAERRDIESALAQRIEPPPPLTLEEWEKYLATLMTLMRFRPCQEVQQLLEEHMDAKPKDADDWSGADEPTKRRAD